MAMNDRQKVCFLYKVREKSRTCRNGCIEWTGNKNLGGYGTIEYTDELTKKRICLPVHRALFMLNNNLELSRDQHVCHKCDNPACINLKHLFLGSAKDNMRDMISKGRQVTLKGRKLGPRVRRTKRQIYIDNMGK